MTQEDKELLLRDLSARLPYGVKMSVNDRVEVLQGINIVDNIVEYSSFLASEIEYCKPYLFPLLSMTEEERIAISTEFAYGQPQKAIDILNKRHIDYRGLIEKGLAIDATGLNIYS